MKNSKKLLILVLSLVLLIGAFAVMAAAEDDAASEVLTIQYPDGTVQTYAEGDPILPPVLPKEFVWVEEDGKGYQYTVTGSAWEGIPASVTPDLLGTTVKATVAGTKGTEQVHFAVYVTGGNTIYYTKADTAGTDFEAYMNYMNAAGSTVVLYEDITCGSVIVHGKVESTYRLDLNGHKLTITDVSGSNSAMDVRQNAFFLYSSKPGGVLDTSKVAYAFRTNDSKYDGVRIDGRMHWGEYDDARTDYGKNLTVYAQAMNPDLYGQAVYYNGGTYIQSENSTSKYLMMLGRTGGSSHTQTIRNCTFVVTKAGTGFLWHPASTTRTYASCTFINASGGDAPVFGSNGAANTLQNCSFYNTNPAPAFGGVAVKYTGSTYVAFTGAIPERPAGEVLMHVTPKTVEAAGVTYTFDAQFVTNTSAAFAVNWGGAYTDYWGVGTTPYYNELALNYIEEKDGSAVYYMDPAVDTSAIVPVTAAMLGTTLDVAVEYGTVTPLAFAWTVGGSVNCEPLGEKNAEEIGQAFHDAFAELDFSATIKLYADLVIPAAMGWGPTFTNSNNVLEHSSLKGGDVTLDLNGHTMSIPELTEGINISNSNSLGSYPHSSEVIFGFEQGAAKTFTLTSSRAGAKILNASELAFLGVGEQDVNHIVINGENIAYIGKGAVTHAFEVNGSTAPKLTVNGGTYVIESARPAFSFQSVVTIKNAKIILTGDAPVAVFGVHNWKRNASFTVEDTVFYSKNETKIFSFIGTTYGAANPAADMSFILTLTNCSFSGINLEKNANLDTYTLSGQMKAESETALLALYGGTKPSGKTAAKYVVDLNGNIVTFYGYGSASEYTTVTYGDFAPIEYYLLGSLLKPVDPEALKSPYYQLSSGIYVAVEGYKGALANAVVTADMLNNRYDAISNINYVEYPLAYVILDAGTPVGHGLLATDDISAALEEHLSEVNDGVEFRFYADIEFASISTFDPSVTLNLNGHALTVSEFICNNAPITVENGVIYYIGGWNGLFRSAVTLNSVSVYGFSSYGDGIPNLTNNGSVTITDSKIYNLEIDRRGYATVVMSGTVFHSDASVDSVIYNNNVEYVTVGDKTYEVVFTRATTDDPSLVANVTFTYKGEEKGTASYFAGSIPAFKLEATEGYYYSYASEDAIYESAELPLVFVADESKLKGRLVVTDALNFTFYLQKQEGLSNLVFCGEALDMAALAVEVIDGEEYYVIPAVFATFADCLKPATISVDVNFGDSTETVTASVSLLNYASILLADENATYEDKALVYALLEYVDAIIEYFEYDVENGIPALLGAYSEYATEYAPEETEEIASDYIRGVLYIVDEQVSLALRVDPDFKGEILLSVPGEEGTVATFIYKDIVELDGSTYVILEDIPFSALAAGYEINVKMYGELVETFTYSIADYANAMTVQNMGYVPAYARALSILATLAAAYVA